MADGDALDPGPLHRPGERLVEREREVALLGPEPERGRLPALRPRQQVERLALLENRGLDLARALELDAACRARAQPVLHVEIERGGRPAREQGALREPGARLGAARPVAAPAAR